MCLNCIFPYYRDTMKTFVVVALVLCVMVAHVRSQGMYMLYVEQILILVMQMKIKMPNQENLRFDPCSSPHFLKRKLLIFIYTDIC